MIPYVNASAFDKTMVEALGDVTWIIMLVTIGVLIYFRRRSVTIAYLLLLVAHTVMFTMLMTVQQQERCTINGESFTPRFSVIGNMPVNFWLAYEGGFCILSLLTAFVIKRYASKSINRSSITEALNNLPVGIFICDEDGDAILTNRAMEQFCHAVFGKTVVDSKELMNLLDSDVSEVFGGIREIIPYDGGVAIRMADGQSYRLSARDMGDEQRGYTEITAQDMTSLYEEMDELSEQQEALHRVRQELADTLGGVRDTERARESLSVKIRIHEKFGQMLLKGKRAYADPEISEDELIRVLSAWEETIEDFYGIFSEEEKKNEYSELMDFAEKLGITIYISDENDYNMREFQASEACYALLREAAINAKRHAEADALYVSVDSSDPKGTRYIIWDNGKQSEGPVEEGGGISSVRQRVEREGGSLKMETEDRIRLTLWMPKQRKKEVESHD